MLEIGVFTSFLALSKVHNMDEIEADKIKELTDKIKELTEERDEALDLVGRAREQVEDSNRLIDQWIEVFNMERAPDGSWLFDTSQSELWEKHADLWKRHQALIV